MDGEAGEGITDRQAGKQASACPPLPGPSLSDLLLSLQPAPSPLTISHLPLTCVCLPDPSLSLSPDSLSMTCPSPLSEHISLSLLEPVTHPLHVCLQPEFVSDLGCDVLEGDGCS